VRGELPATPTVELREGDVRRALGTTLDEDEVTRLLEGLAFEVESRDGVLLVTPPSARLDVRAGREGRADVIEEIARLHGYRRLPRHVPSWPEPGGLNDRQVLRRKIRDAVVDLGVLEAWTPTLVSDRDFDFADPGVARVRITNPLAASESVLRTTLVTGLVQAWAKNVERGTGDVMMGEFGVVFSHPALGEPRVTKGGEGGTRELALPRENERLTVLLARPDDSAITAVALWSLLAERIGLVDVVVRTDPSPGRDLHPTRAALLIDRATNAVLGRVGEIDAQYLGAIAPGVGARRVGLVDLDLDALSDPSRATRRVEHVRLPSRFPSALFDLAFVTPRDVHAQDLAFTLRHVDELVEEVELFDVYEGASLPEGTRSLTFGVRVSSHDRTLSEDEVAATRQALIDAASALGAALR